MSKTAGKIDEKCAEGKRKLGRSPKNCVFDSVSPTRQRELFAPKNPDSSPPAASFTGFHCFSSLYRDAFSTLFVFPLSPGKPVNRESIIAGRTSAISALVPVLIARPSKTDCPLRSRTFMSR